jgi:hypothetical protein
VSLLDAQPDAQRSRTRLYAVSGVALVILLSFGIWYYFLRFLTERRTITSFMDAVVAERFEDAYGIWKARGSYTYEDFLSDWGPDGYYGPIRSYRVYSARSPGGASGTVVVVELSPEPTFPAENDPKSASNRVVSIWVEGADQSLSFPP